MKRTYEIDVCDAIDELRFAELYLHGVEIVVDSLDRSEQREVLAQLVSDCSRRITAVTSILEDGHGSEVAR